MALIILASPSFRGHTAAPEVWNLSLVVSGTPYIYLAT